MKSGLVRRLTILFSFSFCLFAHALQNVFTFPVPLHKPLGPLVQGTNSDFYGVTSDGGSYSNGGIYKVSTDGVLTMLSSFRTPPNFGDQINPGLTLASDGNFYGTTPGGGSTASGQVIRVQHDGTISTLCTFDHSPGYLPVTGVVQGADGYLYGTTAYGGDNDASLIYRVDLQGNESTVLSFPGTGSIFPIHLTFGADGNLYGTTQTSIFKATTTGIYTVLTNFDTNTTGINPTGYLLAAPDGYLYGATADGGPNNDGEIFKISTNGTYVHLAWCGSVGLHHPEGALAQDHDGNVYGSISAGGVFKFGTNGTLTYLSSLYYPFKDHLVGGLVLGSDGNFYGSSEFGGTNLNGAVYRIDSAGTVTQIVSNFDTTIGNAPSGGLCSGVDGNFYGTTRFGGISNRGTIFRYMSDNQVSTIVSFIGANGSDPRCQLVQTADGFFYGTTALGGTQNLGTIFKVSSTGNLTTLFNFAGTNGAYPSSSLCLATNGVFYGVTAGNYTSDPYGTFFSITPAGAFTKLAAITSQTIGAYPTGLIQASNGNFYATATSGGSSGMGSIIRVTLEGTVTDIFNFDGTHGQKPTAPLIQGSDGALYGTTYYGGAGSPTQGTVIRCTLDGSVTVFHDFAADRPTGGVYPATPLLETSPGVFVGTTSLYGANNVGTIFQLNSLGLQTLGSFSAGPTQIAAGPLVKGPDGSIYGTTSTGTPINGGTIFEIPCSLSVLSTVLPPAPAGLPYSTTLNAHSCSLPINWSVNTGSALPPGLSLSPSGAVTGTPASPGSFSFSLHVSDASASALDQRFSMTVTNGPLTILTTTLPDALEGSDYHTQMIATNGQPPYTWSLTPGSSPLPPDLTLSPDGTISSTPTVHGTFYFYVRVTDASSHSVDQILSLNIAPSLNDTNFPAFATIYTFDDSNTNSGAYPYGTLLSAPEGLYGATGNGGAHDKGTIFRLETNGALTVLHSFNGSDGWAPHGPLLRAFDGYLYGSTSYGGITNWGTIFKISPTGNFTSLYSLHAHTDGSVPSALAQANDGNFYGLCNYDGPYTNGTIFRINPAGAFQVIYAFNFNDGSYPAGSLVAGPDGLLYGTTPYGGTAPGQWGTLFSFSTSGSLTTLCSFASSPAVKEPICMPLLASDRNIYGTTFGGGTNGAGGIFKVSSDRTLTTLYTFSGAADGSTPRFELFEAADGNFYSTTSSGGMNLMGTVFSITPQGSFHTIHTFSGPDGDTPESGLAQGYDGRLYGVAQYGGANDVGTIFAISQPALTAPPAPEISVASPSPLPVLHWAKNSSTHLLESTPSLTTPSWNIVPIAPTLSTNGYTVTNTSPAPSIFFRLH